MKSGLLTIAQRLRRPLGIKEAGRGKEEIYFIDGATPKFMEQAQRLTSVFSLSMTLNGFHRDAREQDIY